jgi:hypothetical protein
VQAMSEDVVEVAGEEGGVPEWKKKGELRV